jgi:hypothetical protein
MALGEARSSTLLARLKPEHSGTSIVHVRSCRVHTATHLERKHLGQAALDAREGARPPLEAALPRFMADGLQIQ